MQRLPSEILIDIFGRLEARDLLQVERVCAHWETLVDENVWKKKRTITEMDLGLHSPASIQLDNFITLLRRLHRVDYYCFPFIDMLDMEIRGFYSESILLQLVQLETVMEKMLHDGQIPVHLNVLEFIDHLRFDRQMKEERIEPYRWYFEGLIALGLDRILNDCSIANCQSMIIRYWATGSGAGSTSRTLIPVLLEVNRVDELIIEKLYFSHWNGVSASMFPNFLDKFNRIRILEVVCDDYDDNICISVRFEDTLFSHDEFARALPSEHGQPKDGVADHFGHLVDGWTHSRRIKGVTICKWSVKNGTSALQCDSVPQPKHLQVLHQLLPFNVTSFDIQDMSSCGKSAFLTQLPHHVIGQTVHLRIDVEGENEYPFHTVLLDQLSLSEQMANCDRDMISAWDPVLDVVTLKRLQSLDRTDWVISRKHSSRVIPSPLMPASLPSLQSIKLCGSVCLDHIVSLLLDVNSLRRLEIDINSVEGEQMEQQAFTRGILDIIVRMKTLTTLRIGINGVKSLDPRWLEPWLAFTAVEKANEDETPSLTARLRQEIIQALSSLVHLETLILDFHALNDFFPNGKLSPAGLQHDEQRLCSALPRLCNAQLCVHLSNVVRQFPIELDCPMTRPLSIVRCESNS